MRRYLSSLRLLQWFCFGLLIVMAARHALAAPQATDSAALDTVFQTLTKLELGQDLQQFRAIDQAVVQSRTDKALRTDLEARLVAVLQGEATDLAKDYACRQLAIVGSDTCIPALATLLPSARLAHMAAMRWRDSAAQPLPRRCARCSAKQKGVNR